MEIRRSIGCCLGRGFGKIALQVRPKPGRRDRNVPMTDDSPVLKGAGGRGVRGLEHGGFAALVRARAPALGSRLRLTLSTLTVAAAYFGAARLGLTNTVLH